MSFITSVGSVFHDGREVIEEQFEYRELLWQMTKRDLLLRYKQAVMGFGWAVFMPLTNTAIFSVIFTRVAPINIDVPYPLFVYLGLLVWNFTASALRFSTSSLTGNVSLVTKVYLPREVFPLSAILVTAVDAIVGAVILVAMMAYYRVWPGAALLYLPLIFLVQVLFTAAVGLFLAMANLFFRDVKYLFEVAITLWMFASSVLYPTSLVTGKIGLLLRINPMTAIIDAYRDVLLYGRNPFTAPFAITALFTVAAFAFSGIVFHRAEYRFAETV